MTTALRIVIAGGPSAGKTTLAKQFGILNTKHTDDVKALPWSEASDEVARWFNAPGAWVIEGVTVARALRKWLADNPTGKPADMAIFVEGARLELTSGQEAMRKGCLTGGGEIAEELEARGVVIEVRRMQGREEMRPGGAS